jgi:hypothetical protein
MPAVTRVTQSPMNALRWVLDLACGHEAFVTSKSKPRRTKAKCEKCGCDPLTKPITIDELARLPRSTSLPQFARAKWVDPDFRKEPKTENYCARCQKDIKVDQPYRLVHLLDGGFYILHPEDEAAFQAGAEVRAEHDGAVLVNDVRVGERGDLGEAKFGMDCARKLGLEWSRPRPPARSGA